VRSDIWNFFLKRQSNVQFQPVFGITHHSRLLQQKKISWFCAKWITLLFVRLAVLPNSTQSLRNSQITTIIKTYFIKHRSVQELKTFYGYLLESTFSTFVVGCGSFYNIQPLFKHLYLVGSFKKVLSLGSSLVRVLEARLTSVIWRSFFRSSIIIARKLIIFGCIKVNNQFVTKAIFLLTAGNCVIVVNNNLFVTKSVKNPRIWNLLIFRTPPAHLEVSFAISTIIFLYKPFDTELRFPFYPKLFFVRSFYLQ
jgi:ribosomal protein S4